MDSESINEAEETFTENISTSPKKLHFKTSPNPSSISTPTDDVEHLTSSTDPIENDEQNVYRKMSCTNTIKWTNVGENDQLQDQLQLTLPTEKLLVTEKRIKPKKSRIPKLFKSINEPQFHFQAEDDTEELDEEYTEETNSTQNVKIADQDSERDLSQGVVENINLDWSRTPSSSFSTSKSTESTIEDSANTSASPNGRMSHSDFENKVHLFNSLNQYDAQRFQKYECPWARSSFRSDKTKPEHSLRTPNSFIHQVMHGDFNGNLNKMPTSTQTDDSRAGVNSSNKRKGRQSVNNFSKSFQVPSSTQTPVSPPTISANTQTTSPRKTPTNPQKPNSKTEAENGNSYQNISGGSTTPCSYERLNFNFSNLIKQNFVGNTELNYLGSGIVQASEDLFLESHYYLMINIPALDSVLTTMYLTDSQTDSWRKDYQTNKKHFTDAAKNRIYSLGNNFIKDKSSSNETERRNQTLPSKIPNSSSNEVKVEQINQVQSSENGVNWTNQYEEYPTHTIIVPDPDEEIIIVSESSLPNQTLQLTDNISYKDCLKNQTKPDKKCLFPEKTFNNIPVVQSSGSSVNTKANSNIHQNKKFMQSKTLDSAPIRQSIFQKEVLDNWTDIPLEPENILDRSTKNLNKSRSNWFTKMFKKKKKPNIVSVSETYFVKLENPKELKPKSELERVESELYRCGVYPL